MATLVNVLIFSYLYLHITMLTFILAGLRTGQRLYTYIHTQLHNIIGKWGQFG